MDNRIEKKMAIEALRSGVPNRDAVRFLGTTQTNIENIFNDCLIGEGHKKPLLIEGDFGSGKSHLLEHLRHIALEKNFVCSYVVVSKETPIHDLKKIYRGMVETARLPDKKGIAIPETTHAFHRNSKGYPDFFLWAHSEPVNLPVRMQSLLKLYYETNAESDVLSQIEDDWSGYSMKLTDLKRFIKQFGLKETYNEIPSIKERELTMHRIKFITRLFQSAGYAGWVILFDEIELLAKYGVMQRAKGYAEIARFSGILPSFQIDGFLSVFATTGAFKSEIAEKDLEKISNKIAKKSEINNQPELKTLLVEAKKGINFLLREGVSLQKQNKEELEILKNKICKLHSEAYDWDGTIPEVTKALSSEIIRSHVRKWINELDLKRLFPDYKPDIQIESVQQNLTEDKDFEEGVLDGGD